MDHWDARFLRLAAHISEWSRDLSTQCGCVIVDERHRVISLGFNGFPHGVRDDPKRISEREVKLLLTQHAERNAIAFATRSLVHSTAYIYPIPPCAQCGGGLIQAGVKRIVAPKPTKDHLERWEADFVHAGLMYEEAGVSFEYLLLERD